MKRLFLLMLCLMFILTSCVKITIIMPGDNGRETPKDSDDTVSSGDSLYDDEDWYWEEEEDTTNWGSDTSVDYDLSEMSNIEQYDEALEFVLFFENYVGKSVKLHGQYTKGEYHVFTVADNLNCCYAPFEIITRDGNYPEHEDWVIVKGVLSYLEEGGEKYPYIDVYEVIPSEDRN